MSKLTKKDFKLIARSISEIQDKHARAAACKAFCDVGKHFNVAFNKDTFMDACGVGEAHEAVQGGLVSDS